MIILVLLYLCEVLVLQFACDDSPKARGIAFEEGIKVTDLR